MHRQASPPVGVPKALDDRGPIRDVLNLVQCQYKAVWRADRFRTGLLPHAHEPARVPAIWACRGVLPLRGPVFTAEQIGAGRVGFVCCDIAGGHRDAVQCLLD